MLLMLLLLIPILGIFIISTGMFDELSAINIKRIKVIALTTSIVNLFVSLIIFILFDFSSNQFQFVQEYHEITSFDFYLGVDGLSIYFVLLTTIIIPISFLSNWTSISENVRSYVIIILLLETLLLAVFLVLDILLFYIFFVSILPPLFILIGLFGSSNRVRASFYLFLYTILGSLFLLLSILTMSSIMGTTDFDALYKTNFNYYTNLFLFYSIYQLMFGFIIVILIIYIFYRYSFPRLVDLFLKKTGEKFKTPFCPLAHAFVSLPLESGFFNGKEFISKIKKEFTVKKTLIVIFSLTVSFYLKNLIIELFDLKLEQYEIYLIIGSLSSLIKTLTQAILENLNIPFGGLVWDKKIFKKIYDLFKLEKKIFKKVYDFFKFKSWGAQKITMGGFDSKVNSPSNLKVYKPIVHLSSSGSQDPRMSIGGLLNPGYPNSGTNPNNYDPSFGWVFEYRIYIPDPNGIGDRGYRNGQLNQPYATNLADAMEVHFHRTGRTGEVLFLDQRARNFVRNFVSTEIQASHNLSGISLNTARIRNALRNC